MVKNEIGISSNISLNNLAQNYVRQGQINKAVNTASKALAQAKESGTLQDKKAILETLTTAYIEQENYREALEIQGRLMAVKEKLFNEVKSQQIAEMRTRYETRQKEQEIALLQKSRRMRNCCAMHWSGGLS